MDKTIIDKLVKFGLITNIGVNANDYKDVDDLINKGVITIPGAKSKIAELLNTEIDALVVEEKKDEVVEPQVVENDVVEKTDEPQVVETVESPIVVEEPVEEPVEIVVEETEETEK